MWISKQAVSVTRPSHPRLFSIIILLLYLHSHVGKLPAPQLNLYITVSGIYSSSSVTKTRQQHTNTCGQPVNRLHITPVIDLLVTCVSLQDEAPIFVHRYGSRRSYWYNTKPRPIFLKSTISVYFGQVFRFPLVRNLQTWLFSTAAKEKEGS